MADKYFLSARDQEFLRRLVREYVGTEKGSRPTGRTSHEHDHQEFPAPEIYVARTPSTGIPALQLASGGTTPVNDVPGYDDCDIYQAISDGAIPPTYTLSAVGDATTPRQHRVLNLSATDIAGSIWVIVKRDKFGQWYAEPPSETTFLALITKKTYLTGGFIAYDWIRVTDSDNPAPITYSETTDYGSFALGNPAYHVRNLDLPTTEVDESGATGTGTQLILVNELSVVRMWRGTGTSPHHKATGTGTAISSYYLFGEEPWIDLFRRTGVFDAYGEIAYHRYLDQNTLSWQDGREVRLIEAE